MIVGKGTRLQSGIEHTFNKKGTPKASGLLLKGVVTATYVTDDNDHPTFLDPMNRPLAVYCDVVVYPSIPKQRWFFLQKVLVSTSRGGLHDDDSWQPKATTSNIVTQVLDNQLGANPGQLDGDHVLVGFMNDSFDEPVILRGIPHPSRDVGNLLYGTGKRLKLKQVDGNPDFKKFKGVFRGVDGSGNHVVDSTFGHTGTLLAAGLEPPSDITGTSGNQERKLPQNSTHEITFWNMAVPLVPVEVAKFKCTKTEFEILLTLLPTLKVEGSALTAKLTLGSGAVSATIAEHMETLWGLMVTWAAGHIHNDSLAAPTTPPLAGTPVPPAPGVPPSWNSAINSGKLTFPDG